MTSSVNELVKKKAAKFELKADIKSADEIQNQLDKAKTEENIAKNKVKNAKIDAARAMRD